MTLIDSEKPSSSLRPGGLPLIPSPDGEHRSRRYVRSGSDGTGAPNAVALPSSGRHGYAISSSITSDMLRRAISGVDDRLSHRCGVKPFAQDERCLLRYAVLSSPCTFTLSDGTEVKAGHPVVDRHVWNAHIPPVPRQGPDLAWARLVARWLKHSLMLLARAVDAETEMQSAKAIRARTNFVGWGEQSESLSRLIERFGFEDVDEGLATLPERIHDAFENILIGALTWTHNPEALRRDRLVRRRRPVWMSVDALRGRQGKD